MAALSPCRSCESERSATLGSGTRLRALPVAVALLLALGGCSEADRSQAIERLGAGALEDADGDSRFAASDLYPLLHGVKTVERIAPSAFEEIRAGPGHRLLVLDVSVHNRSRESRVFSEGTLVAVNGGSERMLARPVDMLSDGFLSLQVLEPSARVRGRIVFEIPLELEGRLYWLPGQGGARIPLEGARAVPAAAGAGQGRARTHPINRTGEARKAVTSIEGVPEAAEDPGTGDAQSIIPSSGPVAGPRPVASSEPASTVWSGAGRWPASEGPAFDCAEAWRRVERMICSDETLARMDWELNRAYAIARGSVGDRGALQRQEDAWRLHVRNECTTPRCIAVVYERRIGELYSMARK